MGKMQLFECNWAHKKYKKLALLMMAMMAMMVSAACTTVSQKAARVQVHSQISTLLDSCDKLGPISASAPRIWGPDQAYQKAKVSLREGASDIGGDTVAIVNTDVFLTSVAIQGIAFKCYK
tara:strand:- start:459 stop:821 length:363 start_codon:yes stop_codon:yes gene_type:complete